MRVSFVRDNDTIIIPDPHLGRKFVNDVPLHRRGEREEMVWKDFESRLAGKLAPNVDYHVCVGDLFDKPVVQASDVLRAAEAYLAAARRNPHVSYVVIAGNHDLNRDLSPSSFDLFRQIVEGRERNITIVRDEACYVGTVLFCPWSPTKTAAEIVSSRQGRMVSCAVGHWDMVGDVPNLIPVEQLVSITSRVFTGHDHKRRVEKRGHLTINVVGSMQPYAHGEDEGEMYVTCTLDTLPEDHRMKCLRIMLKPGEVPPDNIDALQVRFQRVDEVIDEALPVLTDHNFNVEALLAQALARRNVHAEVAAKLQEAFRGLRN